MAVSKDDQEKVFLHVMGLMKDGNDGSGEICKTLRRNGIEDIMGIFALTKQEIEDLEYKESNKKFRLLKGQHSMLCIISSFSTKHIRGGAPLKIMDWLMVTLAEFDDFRIIYNPAEYFPPVPSIPGTSTSGISPGVPSGAGVSSAAPRGHDLVRDFKRGIKRDTTLFPMLKDSKQWDPWYIDTKAQARAQDVEDILDPDYTPITMENKEVFEQKQKYMYAVFSKTLLTDKGKSLVREHERDYNAQQVHKKLLDYAQKSTKASVESSQLLTYITSARLGTGSWKGSSHSFILHWQNQVRKYEQLVPTTDCFWIRSSVPCLRMQFSPYKTLGQSKIRLVSCKFVLEPR